jgi:GntR family transcriptional regulator/MocR family aminotransferase
MSRHTPDLPLPNLQLDAAADLPLHRQLYQQLRAAIASGQLKPGIRLPSTRALAKELGVSRITTSEAYRDLLAEGYLEAKVGAGTVVARKLPELFLNAERANQPPTGERMQGERESPDRSPARLSQWGRQLAATTTPAWVVASNTIRPFRLGTPAFDAIPHQAWSRTVARAAKLAATTQLDYRAPAGYHPLRAAIAAYLSVARGVHCTADQVIVVAGAQAGLALITRLLLDPQDTVWMEDPGYSMAQKHFRVAGANLLPIPVDSEGLRVTDGIARCPSARLAYVTPSHQFPLGVTMSYARRRALLQWAQQTSAWIIEDDYDSEYRYQGRPIPALQGLDEAGRVIYVGTFSKVFFPALRLGYLVVPPTLVDYFTAAQHLMSFHPPALEQVAMTEFMVSGDFTRHIRRMRGLYAERRNALLTDTARLLDDQLQLERTPSGLQLVGWLPTGVDEWEMARLAEQQGVLVYPLSAFRLGAADRKGLVLGFAAFDEAAIKTGVEKLARAWVR